MINENQNNLDFLDILNVFGFIIGLKNYNESLTQGDKQELITQLNSQTKQLLNDIHSHLKEQDKKIDKILQILQEEIE